MRADEGIGPYEGLHNRTPNYNLPPCRHATVSSVSFPQKSSRIIRKVYEMLIFSVNFHIKSYISLIVLFLTLPLISGMI